MKVFAQIPEGGAYPEVVGLGFAGPSDVSLANHYLGEAYLSARDRLVQIGESETLYPGANFEDARTATVAAQEVCSRAMIELVELHASMTDPLSGEAPTDAAVIEPERARLWYPQLMVGIGYAANRARIRIGWPLGKRRYAHVIDNALGGFENILLQP